MYKAQYAFNVSMIMCPAVHMATRSLLRSSSTHEPSDPLSRVKIFIQFYIAYPYTLLISTLSQDFRHFRVSCQRGGYSGLPWRSPLEINNTYRVNSVRSHANTKDFLINHMKHFHTVIYIVNNLPYPPKD